MSGVHYSESERYRLFLPTVDEECLSSILRQSLAPFNIVRSWLLKRVDWPYIYLSTMQMFQLPSVVTMTISATRMYRVLSDFVSATTDMYDILRILSFPALTACR